MKSVARSAKRAKRVKRGERKPKKILELILINGYDKEDNKVDVIEVVPNRYGDNTNFTPRQAKRSLLARGAVTFIRTNVYKDVANV
jgi:hypothetical protein